MFRTQTKILAFIYWVAKRLHRRCSTRSWIPDNGDVWITSITLFLCFYCWLSTSLYIGLYAHLTYFRNSCFHCFKQINAMWEWYQKLEKIDAWFLFEHSPKFLWDQDFFLDFFGINLDVWSWNYLGAAIFVTTLLLFQSNRNSQHTIK